MFPLLSLLFQDIALTSGKSSQKLKEGIIVKMLASSKGNEAGYVMRSLQVCLKCEQYGYGDLGMKL